MLIRVMLENIKKLMGFWCFFAKSISFRVVDISIIFSLGELLGLSLQSGACFSVSDTSRKTFLSYDCSNCKVFYNRIKRACSNCMVFYSRIERASEPISEARGDASRCFLRGGAHIRGQRWCISVFSRGDASRRSWLHRSQQNTEMHHLSRSSAYC